MPVIDYTVYSAVCDECPWCEDGYQTETWADAALDEHIREAH